MTGKEPGALPVDALRETFFQWAHSGRPFVFQAPTGSGKSTRLPLWLQELHGKCLVVEPRRMACTSLASFLARERAEQVGEHVGLCMRGVRAYGERTKILFVTPGIAIRMLAARDPWSDCVLVDEFHERSVEMDLLLTALRARKGVFGITSATIDGQKWSEEWSAEWMTSQGRTHPVVCSHDPDWATPSRQRLDERIAEALAQAVHSHKAGDILVFLPGMREIQDAIHACRPVLQREHLQHCVAHSTLGKNSIDALFDSTSKRRVYFATNVAETSVTFPNIRVVIDSGLEKRSVHRGGRAVLLLHAVSAASAEQRKGRAGRVGPGHCYRLYRTAAALESHTPPEIERTPLDDLCCQAAACHLDLSSPHASPWPTPPPEQAFVEAIHRLQGAGVLDEERRLSETGMRCSMYPTSAQHAGLLLDAPPELLPQLCALVALMDAGRGCLRGHINEHEQSMREEILAGLHEIEREVAVFFIDRPKRLGIDEQRLDSLRRVQIDLMRHAGFVLGTQNESPPVGSSYRFSETFLRHIMSRDPTFCFAKRTRSASSKSRVERTAYANEQVEIQCEEERFIDEPDLRPFPPFVMIFQQRWQMQAEGRAPFGLGAWWVPIEPKWLLAENVGHSVPSEIEWPNRAKSPQFRFETQLAGIAIGSQLRRPSPSELHRWVATQLEKSAAELDAGAAPTRVWRAEVASELRSKLRVWDAWAFWEGQVRPPAWSDFVVQRLEALGVETYEDLELLERSDWLPDLASICDIPAWEQEKWQMDFPLRWNFEGGWYRCDLEAQGVILRPTDAKSKKQKNIPEPMVPRFRGKAVFLQHASRRVRLR